MIASIDDTGNSGNVRVLKPYVQKLICCHHLLVIYMFVVVREIHLLGSANSVTSSICEHDTVHSL